MSLALATAATTTSWWARHGGHALLLGGPALLLGGIAVYSDLRARFREGRTRDGWWRRTPAAVLVAALFSLGAAAVHLRVCPEHFREATIYGLFFAVAAGCQTGWAFLVCVWQKRWLLYAGVAGNAAIVALWAVTRTVGVPLGPGRGETEEIGALDVIACICEVGVIVAALVALRVFTRAVASPRATVAEVARAKA